MADEFKSEFRRKAEIRTIMGQVDGKQLRFLAHVERCNKAKCPLADSCAFNPQGKCTVIYNFLRSLYYSWVDPNTGVGDVLSQMQLDRIGTHLMPLYHQLARFTLEASVLTETTYTNKQGGESAHPHFKEIREVLREIRAELKDLNLEKAWTKKFPDKGMPSADIDEVMQHGRRGSYKDMVKRAHQQEKLAKGKGNGPTG
jgi:hypothetical protein